MLSVPKSVISPEPQRSAQVLLPLKLHTPPPRAGVLLRPDLQALLSEVRLNPVTLVVAPAGYGKTTLLSQWVEELARTGAPVCWLSLDSGDRDPALFLAYLIKAIQSVFPALGVDAWRVLHSAINLERDWPLVAGALCSDLQRNIPTATFLFLDDVHLVTESAVIGQILGYVLRAAPPTLHIVMAARRAPTFVPLGRLRAEGRLVEVSQRELHLSADDVRQILATQGIELDNAELALLLQRTEGWALSVQLAARALVTQPPEHRGTFVRALSGSQEQLLNYLATEVLAELPQELIDFLRLASLPASFDAALLTDVLARDDIPYLLQRAQALGLPIMPLDAQGNQLRFHPLWREVLLRGLSEAVDSETRSILHRRFGRAFEARNDLEAALEHYSKAGAKDDLARMLRERAWPLLRSPKRDAIHRWLDQISADVREHDANLLHLWGVSQAVTESGPASLAIERAALLYREAGLFDRELRALADLSALLIWQIPQDDFIAICIKAIHAANRMRNAWSRGAMRVCVAAILYNKGRNVAALRVGRQAIAQPLYPTWRWLLAMIVGSINVQLGRPAEALTILDETLELPQVDLDERLRQNLLFLRALVLYQQGQIVEATALALEAHRQLSNYYRIGVAGRGAAQLALLLALQNRVDEATTYLSQARVVFHEMGELALLTNLQALEVYITLRRGQLADANAAVSRVLRRLQELDVSASNLTLWMLLALVLGEAGEYQRALTLTQEIIDRMQAQDYRQPLASALLYQSYLAGQSGDQALRLQALRTGWEIVVENQLHSLPVLPAHVVRDVAIAALRQGIAPKAIGDVLRSQMPEHVLELLQALLAEPNASVRADVARLISNLGGTAVYTSLRTLAKDRDVTVRKIAETALSSLVYRPPYTLRIRTLGAFTLWRGDQEVRDRDWRSSKARHLFQILLTERGRTLPRERILDILWPDMEPDAAANNLRVTVNRLSKAIEPDRPDGTPSSYIIQQGDTYSFNLNSDHKLDAEDFVVAVSEAQRAERRGQRQAAVAAFRRATTLYGGQYLPDSMYEDWAVVERERLTMLFNDAALRLGSLLLDEGIAHEAIGLAWRVLENDQAQEDAYRLLMRAHASLGERSAALRLYTRCVHVLQTDLGVEPLPETVALYNTLREMR